MVSSVCTTENIMDHLAAKLEMDPLEFRLKNFLKEGDLMLHGGHKFAGTNPLPDMIEELSKSSAFEERKKAVEAFNQNNKWKKRGMSCVPIRYGVGRLTPMPNYCHISVLMMAPFQYLTEALKWVRE